MITNYRCPKCQNLFSEQQYPLHYKYCQGVNIPVTTTTQVNPPIITTTSYYTPITTNYTDIPNTINYTTIPNQTNIINIPNTTNYTTIPNKTNIINIPNTNNYTTIPTPNHTNYTTIPQNQTYIPSNNNINITRPYRPQTAIYNNPLINQVNPNVKTTVNPQNYIYNNNYGINMKVPSNGYFICDTCGERVPLTNKKDHLLCHKLEQEDKDLLQAQKLQDDDIFNNVSQEEVDQQKKIEEYIKREQQQRRNNNFSGNNINNTNDFNFRSDFGNLNGINEISNMGNRNGMPNVIIRRFVSNGNSPNIGDNMGNPEFFSNFFNQGFNNNNPPGITRIMIPVSFMGNNMGGQQNDLNEMIEHMLHYSRENPTDAAIVSELPEQRIDDIKKLDKDKQNCVICMEDFKNGDKSTNLPCLHMFHTNCIQSWLKTQNTCPICKFKLTPDNINNINRRG